MLVEETGGLGSYRTHPRTGHPGRRKNACTLLRASLGHSPRTCCGISRLWIPDGVHAVGTGAQQEAWETRRKEGRR